MSQDATRTVDTTNSTSPRSVSSTYINMDIATSMAAHRPFAVRVTTVDMSSSPPQPSTAQPSIAQAATSSPPPVNTAPIEPLQETAQSSAISAPPENTPGQPIASQQNGESQEQVAPAPVKKKTKKSGVPTGKKNVVPKKKGKLALLKAPLFELDEEVLGSIKTSDPLSPLNMPLLKLKSTHGETKVLLHCQTGRLYNPTNGTYLGDLVKFSPKAAQQLEEALEERGMQKGPESEEWPEGISYSAVLKKDEVLVGRD